MAVPLVYNLRSVRARWVSAIVAVLGIAGTVGVFIAMLALAKGFQSTLVSSGSPDNAIIMRAGATSEMLGSVTLDQVKVLQDDPSIAKENGQPVMSPEVVVMAPFPLQSTGTDANVQVRGVSDKALRVRSNIHMVAGRFFQPGLLELVVGKNAASMYQGVAMGDTVKFGGGTWKVVGVFDAGGSAFDSEIWGDAHVLSEVYKRPDYIFQSVTARLTSPAAITPLKDHMSTDPRMTVDVQPEIVYYSKQSQGLTTLIHVLGGIIAVIMGIGAIFGALNTMYSAVSERSREIATMRAIGFGSASVVTSFIFEALFIAFIGGVLGSVAALPLNWVTTGAMNFQTFSHLAFAFKVTPGLIATGIGFALLMGLIGGVPPAIRAASRPVAQALRDL
ncbi:MAG TPA: ABC transporter permease [Candidatus Saccharimonadales bacterium]|nr:ABC transporter permease [Candidatus Saccharimonadales bacterium]